MKATRTTQKQRPPLPYSRTIRAYAQKSSLVSRAAQRMGAAVASLNPLRRGHTDAVASALSRAAGASGAAIEHSGASAAASYDALCPGDVLRDRPFFTQSAEVLYFSTHPSLCADVFGVEPGEVWRLRQGNGDHVSPLGTTLPVGETAVVLGARGGQLWVYVYGESVARTLYVPPVHPGTASTSTAAGGAAERETARLVRESILAYHGACLLLHPYRAMTPAEAAEKSKCRVTVAESADMRSPAETTLTPAQQHRAAADEAKEATEKHIQEVCATLEELRQRAAEEAERLYTAEQRAFLQGAPDLYVACVHPEETRTTPMDHGATMSDDAAAGATGATTTSRSTHQEPREQGMSGGEDAEAAEHRLPITSFPGRSATAPASTVEPSVYAAVAWRDASVASLVLLTPRVVGTTGTAGWAGEGDVTVPAMSAGDASLSASVVI